MGIICAAVTGTAIAIKFNKKIEETLAVSIILITLLIYIPAGFFGLIPGLVIAFGFTAICLIYCIYGVITGRSAFKASLLTWGGLALVIYGLFFAYYAFHRDFSHPDELYSWGLIAKNYYHYLDMNSPLATDMGGDQTPFLPLWNVFSAYSWVGFSDSICYFAQNMFVISLLIPVFARIKAHITAPKFLIITLMLPSLLMLSGLEAFRYILADAPLAAALCFFFINVIAYIDSEDNYYYVSSLIGIVSICMIKRSGVLFAGLMIIIVTSVMLRRTKRAIPKLVLYAAVSTIFVISWMGFTDITFIVIPVLSLAGAMILHFFLVFIKPHYDKHRDALLVVAASGTALFMLGAMTLIARCGNEGYGFAVMARFMHDLFTITTGDGFIILSYGIYLLIVLSLGVYLYRYRTDSDKALICFHTALAMVIYALIMLFELITNIGPLNEYRESIIPRYMIPWEVFVTFILIYVIIAENLHIRAMHLLIAFVILISVSDTAELYRGLFNKHICIGYYAMEDAGIELKPGDMVYYIDEVNQFNYSDREFYYCSWPAKTNLVDDIFLGNNGRMKIDEETLRNYLKSDMYLEVPYDYLYLQSYEDDFIDRFGQLFENTDDIAPGTVYYVVIDGEDVTLKKANHS